MRKFIYYSPYIPILGYIVFFLATLFDYETIITDDPEDINDIHFFLSAVVQAVSIVIIFLQ